MIYPICVIGLIAIFSLMGLILRPAIDEIPTQTWTGIATFAMLATAPFFIVWGIPEAREVASTMSQGEILIDAYKILVGGILCITALIMVAKHSREK